MPFDVVWGVGCGYIAEVRAYEPQPTGYSRSLGRRPVGRGSGPPAVRVVRRLAERAR